MDARLLEVEEDAKEPNAQVPVSCCHRFWKDPKLLRRLNVAGVTISLVDNFVDFFYERITDFAEFFNKTLPFAITGLFYTLPSLVPYFPSLLDYFRGKTFRTTDAEIEDLKSAAKQQLQEYKKLLEKVLQDHENERDKLLDLYKKLLEDNLEFQIKEYQSKNNTDTAGLVINTIYNFVRMTQGIVSFVRGAEGMTEEEHESTAYWLDFVNDLTSLIYMSAMFINYYRSQMSAGKEVKGVNDFKLLAETTASIKETTCEVVLLKGARNP